MQAPGTVLHRLHGRTPLVGVQQQGGEGQEGGSGRKGGMCDQV